jgi:hypothetical protein
MLVDDVRTGNEKKEGNARAQALEPRCESLHLPIYLISFNNTSSSTAMKVIKFRWEVIRMATAKGRPW